MDHHFIINEFTKNKEVFKQLLSGIPKEEYLWRPSPEKWCLLEIVCHLYDEERDDFRTRVRLTLENPEQELPQFDTEEWVTSRNYLQQDYNLMLEKFLEERKQSIEWLKSLSSPDWKNTYNHPKFGAVSSGMFLSSWLAHDYLHFRQIVALKYNYLKFLTGESLEYAGRW